MIIHRNRQSILRILQVCAAAVLAPLAAVADGVGEQLELLRQNGVAGDTPSVLAYLKIALLLVSAIGISKLAGAEPKPTTDRKQLEALVEQLGDDEFVRRELAMSKLTKLGESAYEVLGRHRKHPDPEVRARVRAMLQSLEGLPRIDPKLEESYKSGSGGTAVSLSFENRSKKPIRIYWITTSGERKAWRGLLKPGEKALCDRTFSSHVWLITDADSVGLGLYVVGKKQARIIVRGSE